MYRRKSGVLGLPGLVLGMVALGVSGLQAQTTAPLPAVAPGGPPNIFYGGVNPSANSQSPVILFVHGLGSNAEYWFTKNNTMYTDVYNSGYRSAYISMNADNSNNSAPIAQNATTLQGLLPIILAHFNVNQLYIVSHSKGGLDTQMAMMDPGFRSAVKAIFTLATPNQGTALADWAFGPGAKIASIFGLNTPGLYDLRPENVANLRAQFDPVFATAGIPFYYLEGTTYTAQGTGGIVYNITGPILSNLTNGELNDGLVAEDEVMLPDSYAEDIGTVAVDHTVMGFGINVYPYIYGRISGLENRMSAWQKIASGGFGDDQNTWNWSQIWWQGNLYVGTGRNVDCITNDTAAVQTGLPLYPNPNTPCPLDPLQIATPAEVWRYTPQTKTWMRVYKAVQDIPLGIGINGQPQFAAEALGFRSFGIYTESDGTQALYVGGVSGNSMYNLLPMYTNFNYPPPIMLRTTDGLNFTPISQDPGTFLGDIVKNNQDVFVCSYRSIIQANGQMWVAVTDFRGEGFIMTSTNPSAGNNAFQRVSPAPAIPNFAVWVLSAFNNAIYVGTGDRTQDDGYGVYKTTNQPGDPVPYTFTPIILQGGWQADESIRSPTALTMHVWTEPDDHQPHLFVGTDRKIEMVRVNTDDTWDIIMGQPRTTPDGFKAPLSGIGFYFDNDFSGHIWQIQDEGNIGLFASTWDWSILLRSVDRLNIGATQEQGFDFFTSPDAVHWYIISKNGLGDGLNMGGRSGSFNHFGLFWGTARSSGGSQEWVNNTILDLNNDGKISQADANIIQAALGQTVTGFDARDVNGNGVIDAQDMQYLESQCTFPNCSEIPPPGIAWNPPAATFQGFLSSATQSAVGNTVSLQWPAQPNVARYHVYRYTSVNPITLLGPFPTQTVDVSPTVNFQYPTDVLAGKVNPFCPTPYADDLWYCQLNTLTQQANSAPANGQLSTTGFMLPVLEIAQTTGTTYSEPMPSNTQSLYFVKSEDRNGNLTQASNIVGAPSFQQVPQSQ